MKITVIAAGKIKESYFSEAVAEYEKRLGRYARVEIITVPDEKTPEEASPAEEEQIKEKEGKRILARVKSGAYVIALAVEGAMMDSEALAAEIADLQLKGKSEICFIIGGSLGLSDEVKRRADQLLSFSRFTFPHQLMRVILLEQIYRSFKINAGEPYHK